MTRVANDFGTVNDDLLASLRAYLEFGCRKDNRGCTAEQFFAAFRDFAADAAGYFTPASLAETARSFCNVELGPAGRIKNLSPRCLGEGNGAAGRGETNSGKGRTGDASPNGTAGLATTRLDEIRLRPVHFLIPNLIPLGKLVTFAGDGGSGKSTITLDMAARLTKGEACCGLTYDPLPPCDVLLVSCEDDFADTVVPRLLAAGADLSRVHRVDGIKTSDGKTAPFCLGHLVEIEATLEANPEIRLVVVDPAGAYIGRARVDDHKDSELQSLLGPLAELAARRNVTIILVKHFNKGASARAIHRVTGGVGYTNCVRVAFAVTHDSEDSDRRLLIPIKSNLPAEVRGLSFRMQTLDSPAVDGILRRYAEHLGEEDRSALAKQLFRIAWEGPTDETADSILSEQARQQRGGANKVGRCMEWLRDFLASHAYPSNEVLAAAKDEGYTFDNLKEAKARLKTEGLRSSNMGQFQGAWWNGFGEIDRWSLRPTPYTPKTPNTTPISPH